MTETQEVAFQVGQELFNSLREEDKALREVVGQHKTFLRENWPEALIEVIKWARNKKELMAVSGTVYQKLPGLEVKEIRELLGLTPQEFIELWLEEPELNLQLLQQIEQGSRENKRFTAIAKKIWQERIPGLLRKKRDAVELNAKDLLGFLPSALALTREEYLALERGERVAEIELITWIFDILSQMEPKKRWPDEERAKLFLEQMQKKLLELKERNKIVERKDRLSPKSMHVLNNLIEDAEKLKQCFGKRELRDRIISTRGGLHILREGIQLFLLRECVRQAIDLFDYFQVIATQTGCLGFFYYDPLLLTVARAKADEKLSRVKNF